MSKKIHHCLPSLICLIIAVIISAHEFWQIPTKMPTTIHPIVLAEDAPPALEPPSFPQETGPETVQLIIGKGDTFAKLLKNEGFSNREVHNMMQCMKKHYNPRTLTPQHLIELTRNTKDGHFLSLTIRPRIDQEIIIIPKGMEDYQSDRRDITLEQTMHFVEGSIGGSLYQALVKENVPASMIHSIIMAYSYDVDFQRSIQLGDSFALLYTTYQDPNTGRQRPGELLCASLTLNGKPLYIYRFEQKSGDYNYYSPTGASMRKGLLRTPIDGARISSGFGLRRHPVLGYTKQHKGVDFAAPSGTPIMAAGGGTVEKIGPFGSYGNYIRIRHSSGYATAYAHLSRYASGLHQGQQVPQGRIIGYVGTTGRSSGAHLHYEVLQNNKQINPMKLKLIPSTKLAGNQLNQFRLAKAKLDQHCQRLKSLREEAEIQLAMKEATPE